MVTVNVPLDSEPDYCIALGRLIGHFGNLESQLTGVLGFLLDLNQGTHPDRQTTLVIYQHFISTASKVELLKRLVKLRIDDATLKAYLLTLLDEALSLNGARNGMVHCQWGSSGPGGALTRIPLMLEHPKSNKPEQLKPGIPTTVQDVQDVVRRTSELAAKFVELSMNGYKAP